MWSNLIVSNGNIQYLKSKQTFGPVTAAWGVEDSDKVLSSMSGGLEAAAGSDDRGLEGWTGEDGGGTWRPEDWSGVIWLLAWVGGGGISELSEAVLDSDRVLLGLAVLFKDSVGGDKGTIRKIQGSLNALKSLLFYLEKKLSRIK